MEGLTVSIVGPGLLHISLLLKKGHRVRAARACNLCIDAEKSGIPVVSAVPTQCFLASQRPPEMSIVHLTADSMRACTILSSWTHHPGVIFFDHRRYIWDQDYPIPDQCCAIVLAHQACRRSPGLSKSRVNLYFTAIISVFQSLTHADTKTLQLNEGCKDSWFPKSCLR